ncbi:MAG: hypothetical protein Ta2G_09840 [Termitinemataceae bacterium]|nr:MAG: hypothetical protein Ta2G_09840 [Termitinemataceae bacterium]
MKKKNVLKTIIIALLSLIASLSAVLLFNQDAMRFSPWQKTDMIDYCIYASGNKEYLAISGNGKQSVVVVNRSNELVYRLDAKAYKQKAFSSVEFFTLDTDNNLYVLDVNYAGFFNDNVERIVKYDAKGQFAGEIYSYSYRNEDYIFSKGKISGITYSDSYIYIVRSEHDGFYLERIACDGFTEAERIFFYPYSEAFINFGYFDINPQTKYLAVVTKSGTILQYDFEGNLQGQWPAPPDSLPYMAISDGNNNIIYSDIISCEIIKINTKTNARAVIVQAKEGVRYDKLYYANGTLYAVPNNEYILMLDDMGTIGRLDFYKFTNSVIYFRWLLIFVLVCDILAILAFVVLAIVQLQKRQITKTARRICLATICIVLGAGVSAILIVRDMNIRIDETDIKNLENISRIIGSSIDIGDIQAIGNPTDWDLDEYKNLRREVMSLFEKTNLTGQTIYQNIWLEKDGIIYSMYDSEGVFGTYYPYDSYDEGSYFKNVYENGIYVSGSEQTLSGLWISVCGPIFDENGTVAALIETGRNLKVLEEQNHKFLMKTVLTVLFAVIIAIVLVASIILVNDRKKRISDPLAK